MNYITTQQISNDPVFTDVERTVGITMQLANSNAQQFEMHFQIEYKKNGNDVNSKMQQPAITKLIANNEMQLIMRDENFQPIQNPDWDGIDEATQYMMIGGWDYIMMLINSPVNIAAFMQGYIIINDQEGFFNQ